ncbi:TPA: hypothetical protein ACN7NQ_005257, partial [Escherichia coli]
SMSDIKNALDVAAFTMAGNLMVTLFDKGVISREEAIHIINLAQKNSTPENAEEIQDGSYINTDWHFDNLRACMGITAEKD